MQICMETVCEGDPVVYIKHSEILLVFAGRSLEGVGTVPFSEDIAFPHKLAFVDLLYYTAEKLHEEVCLQHRR